MTAPTDADREQANRAWRYATLSDWANPIEVIAQALADEREKARAPFLALADELDREMGTDDGVALPSRTAWRIRRAAEGAQ